MKNRKVLLLNIDNDSYTFMRPLYADYSNLVIVIIEDGVGNIDYKEMSTEDAEKTYDVALKNL